ncbi:hypothetical protein CEUSTIGMA_g3790.t1 [Chlamydomonas eustigma]|uniref:Rhodanese domain-containing protein n=1 Tax=Chlamydomonas eustigma TaxID=1157962 RepID=A0A250WZS2_9CHLO|nr:hypothetical protein CEUSTIGMA_g3790.t1 [Chlamydomonas eustigma]|eukprot:GAX76344.1 hypothetical protein CEUSTIGMA_g3790.t1 [Chlamydomonas eustigma]
MLHFRYTDACTGRHLASSQPFTRHSPVVRTSHFFSFTHRILVSEFFFKGDICSWSCTAAAEEADGSEPSFSGRDKDGVEWCIVNFYHLVQLEYPEQLVEEHRRWLEASRSEVKGRIYFSSQGVNAQFGGPRADALAYTHHLMQHPLFKDLRYSVWPANGPMFPKLRLKYKPNLISLAGGMKALPVTDPSSRATALQPSKWREMIAKAEERKVVVLDVRNGYEWDAGHFQGAGRPAEEVFNETPVGEGETDVPAPLRGASSDTPIMMYCTGGIRCDVYSTFLRSKGFDNLYTLEGGIQAYLKEEGPEHWKGSLYVFDGRMAIPGNLKDEGASSSCGPAGDDLPAAVPCQICNSADAQLPHMNCANIDCNELFISCTSCKGRFQGCCCEECMSAPRLLRPIKLEGGHYGQWGNYASQVEGEGDVGRIMATGRSSEGRLARRARRREVIKQRREKQVEEKKKLKTMMRDAMAKYDQQKMEQESKNEDPVIVKQLL